MRRHDRSATGDGRLYSPLYLRCIGLASASRLNMDGLTGTRQSSRLGIAALAVVLGIGAWTAAPTPAEAQFWFGFGPRYYAPFPYYYPPPAYYPYYRPPAAYYPPAAPAYGAPATPAAGVPAAPRGSAAITYTDRPA